VSTKLFVGNLPWTVNDDALKTAFESHGVVITAKVINDRQTGRSRGFGFVEMENETEANTAIQALNGSQLKGRNIIVSEAKAKNVTYFWQFLCGGCRKTASFILNHLFFPVLLFFFPVIYHNIYYKYQTSSSSYYK
jgi:RNA recognition motif-containing protein